MSSELRQLLCYPGLRLKFGSGVRQCRVIDLLGFVNKCYTHSALWSDFAFMQPRPHIGIILISGHLAIDDTVSRLLELG